MSGDIAEKLAALAPNHTTDEAFDAVDVDQSGTISRAEFAPVYEHGRQQEREKIKALTENKILRWGVGVLFLAVIIIIAVTSGVTAGVVEANKDAYTQHAEGDTEAMTDGRGKILGVREQTVSLPLLAAPVLSEETLADTRTIKATVYDAKLDTKVKKIYHIATVSIVSRTAVSFKTVEGDELFVWNGETYLETVDGARITLCSAEAKCAALQVEGADKAEELMAEAIKELVDAGFMDESTAGRRRLNDKDCKSGSSSTATSCNKQLISMHSKVKECKEQLLKLPPHYHIIHRVPTSPTLSACGL